MISKIKAIIFDFDGVILDSVNIKTLAFEEMYSEYGVEIKKKVRDYHLLHGGVSRFEKIRYFHKVFLRTELSDSDLQKLTNKFSTLVFEGVCNSKYIAGSLEFLKYSSSKFLTFICTGTPQNEIEDILKRKNLSNYFNEVFGSPKNKVTIIKNILKKYDLNFNEVLFIGDAMTDYKAAKETRINFVGINNNETTFPDGTSLVDNLMEIVSLLGLENSD